MAIELATQFQAYTDEQFYSESKTSLVTNKDFSFDGAKTIKLYKVKTTEMEDFNRNGPILEGSKSQYGTISTLQATTETALDDLNNGNWDNYKGKIATLGLISGDDPTANYVQIPMETTQWEDGKFTQDDYKAMVKDMFDGKITVSNDVSKAPSDFATVIAVEDQGAIKG